ncbi:iron ABC transporter permease [Pseudonocardia hydrocarbonoxydans]|uniref:Iron-hydroxamate transporter permease subunit n=1 Tax=Pseudonocardia hydrocarbonoxydans TaxID=76726 RepID=A0A4Y3WP48_9PSEU|nr:iron ABC transporter permease [Pseudonocardia hydrocarbonoxydans]GEC20574.1 iron-hydroxamate transporter permease subunit [Pseudonocardia hydrocarbonoxydans]
MTLAPSAPAQAAPAPARPLRVTGAAVAGTALVVLIAAVHLTQGTAAVDAADLWALLTGGGTDQAAAVVVASRLPRLLAGLVVGAALGAAGAALQSIARNSLAAPDTLGVNAGAHLAVVAVAAVGLSLPFYASGLLAFAGGLAAAGLVLALSAGGGSAPTRLVLAGSAVSLALYALTTVLLLLFAQETAGLYAWGSGSLAQTGLSAVGQAAPVVALGIAVLVLLGRRLDVLGLGDDTAQVLGVPVRRTRVAAVVLAALLSAAAVTVAGPVGFVGLCAPAVVRILAPLVPGLHRHRVLVPFSALAGVAVVLGADVVVRAALGGQAGVEVPTGVVTTVFGAVVLVLLAQRFRDSGPVRHAPSARSARLRDRRTFTVVVVVLVLLTAGVAAGALLLGDATLLGGDVLNWLAGRGGRVTTFVLDTRVPRVLAALLAGAALALAGTAVQAVCRNPLADPGLLGVSGGAGLAAVAAITLVPTVGTWALAGVTAAGALAACALVFGLAARGGLASDRLVLIGVGVSYGTLSLITVLIVQTDPFNETKALTWLSGSTYGRTFVHLVPVLVALVLATVLLARARAELDLMALDDDTPRVLGIALGRTRLALLTVAALLTAAAVAAVGVISFVGLVAPHAARALVGSRHTRVVPVAMLLGAVLVCLADLLGRAVIAPAQLPAGLLTAVIGTPYFVWLLWRSRARA